MKMFQLPIFSRPIFISLQILILLHHVNSMDRQYHLKIYKADSCDHSNTTYIIESITVKQQGKQDHLHVVVDLLRDVTAASMAVEIEKCLNSDNTCEQLTNFVVNDFCLIFKMKKSFWNPMIDAIKPKPNCPHLQKGRYVLEDGTMDVNYLAKLDPDSPKYTWKLKATLKDTDGKVFACGVGEGSLE